MNVFLSLSKGKQVMIFLRGGVEGREEGEGIPEEKGEEK
jgi:hypothetical protein